MKERHLYNQEEEQAQSLEETISIKNKGSVPAYITLDCGHRVPLRDYIADDCTCPTCNMVQDDIELGDWPYDTEVE